MAAPLSSAPQASPRSASAASKAALPAAPQEKKKADPKKPLENVRAGQDDSRSKSYFPQSGSFEAYCERSWRNVADFLNNLAGNNAMFIFKAHNALVKSILGGHVQRPREYPHQLVGEVPDVGEHDYGNGASERMIQGASSVYKS